MGTSRNDPSPSTPPWRMANSILGRKNITAKRQNTQIWRAAITERGEQIINDFGHPILAATCKIANECNDVLSAIDKYNTLLADNYESGLNLDMGKRALIRTISLGGKSINFASELFSEAVSYYASRDLPSIVGTDGRISTASEVIELKNLL